jgi:hypothetical protein
LPDETKEVATVDTKPAVGVYAGALVTLGLSLANRYTSYQPTVEEAGAILVIVSGAMMWLVPTTFRKKLENQEGE